MEEKQTIMICTENLDIGGVETVVCNQAIYLQKQGYRVVVLAKEGRNKPKLEEQGITIIDFEFPLENAYNISKAQELVQIAKEYQVSQIHVHKLPCVTVLLPAFLLSGIPYVAYVHVSIDGIYEWYQNCYPIYKEAFPMFYTHAEKIVSITPSAKQRNQKWFGVPDEKYVICHNAINFEEYQTNQKTEKIQHFLILSRFVEEKMKSIKNGIDIYLQYKEKSNREDVSLEIVGGGPEMQSLTQYTSQYQNANITVRDGVAEVKPLIEAKDVVIGVDRSILEAVALKKIAIISRIPRNKADGCTQKHRTIE